jgi:hypothetical protein
MNLQMGMKMVVLAAEPPSPDHDVLAQTVLHS